MKRPITIIAWRDASTNGDNNTPNPTPGRDIIIWDNGLRWDDTRHAMIDSARDEPYWWSEAPAEPDVEWLTLDDLLYLIHAAPGPQAARLRRALDALT